MREYARRSKGAYLTNQRSGYLLFATLLLLGLVEQSRATPQQSATVESHLAAAQEAQRAQNYRTAEQEYRLVLQSLPDFAEIHMNLGLVLQLEGRIPEATSELTRSLQLKPGLAGANLMLGINLCKLGQGSKAVPLLTRAVEHDPKRVEGYSWLATAQEMTGNFAGELLTIQRALELQPDNADLQYLEGHVYERLGEEEVQRMNSAAAAVTLSERLLGESYASSAEWPTAFLHFERAIATAGSSPGLHVELGEVLLRAGKLDRATREFDHELQVDSSSVRALVGRGETRLFTGELDRAMADWTRALAIDTPYVEHLLGLGHAPAGISPAQPPSPESLEQIDKLEPRLLALHSPAAHLASAFLASLHNRVVPEDSEAHSALKVEHASSICSAGVLKKELEAGRLSAAASCGLQVLTPGSSPQFRLLVAASLLAIGEYEASLRALSVPWPTTPPAVAFLRARCYEELSTGAYLQLYRTNPESFRVHQLMADLSAARGDDRKAAEEYRAAIALNPTAPNLHYSLGHTLWKSSDISGAQAEFKTELNITPNHVGALHDLGQTCLMERHPQQALDYLNQAVASGGKGPDLDRDLGTAYAQLGDYRNAEIKYNQALPGDHDGSLHFKLAKAYQALGEKEKASREFVVAADLSRKFHTKLEEETPRRQAIEE